MSTSIVGLLCLLGFVLSQGVRDALFGNVFQSVSFLIIAALAFGMATLCFSVLTMFSRPTDFKTLALRPLSFIGLNLTTAAAWLSFFFGLQHLEPAVAATLYNGSGPLAVLLFTALGWTKGNGRQGRIERGCYVGIAVALAALAYVSVTGKSGLTISNPEVTGLALFAVAFGGMTIAASHLIARQLNDSGIGSNALMGTRFIGAFGAALVIEMLIGRAAFHPPIEVFPLLALLAFAIITIPSFLLQLGIARASPLTANVMRALGPVCVFSVQQFDGRLQFSTATLLCILAFSGFAILASIIRGYGEIRRPATGQISPEPIRF